TPACGCDHVPKAMRELAREWLYDADLPAEWETAVAEEFDAAIADRKLEIVSTHEQGRPYDTPLVEWEHRDLDPVAEMLAEHGRARRKLGESLMEDCIPAEDAPEAAASQERW
ncbi:hypothetical protein LCGC14_2085080, partial [marine sediment metagenome]